MADIAAPAYRIFPIIPALKPGAMENVRSFVANEKIQTAIGFPGQLVEDWHDKAIAKMGELLGKYRSLRVFMDACVHCGPPAQITSDHPPSGHCDTESHRNYSASPDL